MWHNGRVIKSHYCHDLHWLQYGCTIGIRVSTDRTLHFYINGQDQGIAAYYMPTVCEKREMVLEIIYFSVLYFCLDFS